MIQALRASVAVLALGTPPCALAIEVGDAWPGASLARPTGAGALTAGEMAGKVTVVNFWATWCEACKVELVEMEKLFEPHLKEKDLNVAFVSLDKEPDKAINWFKLNLREPSVMLSHLYSDARFELAERLEVDAFPMTLVIGRDGRVVHVQRGFKEGEGTTEEIVRIAEAQLRPETP